MKRFYYIRSEIPIEFYPKFIALKVELGARRNGEAWEKIIEELYNIKIRGR
jgi:hypothetical protein